MKTKKEIEERRRILVEKNGLFMEKADNLAPIEARIFSILLLSKEEGMTFDELVKFLNASKSTISTNLKKLEKKKMVSYYTKPGDRKKYFILSADGFLAKIDDDIRRYKQEHTLISEIIEFKAIANNILPEDEKLGDLEDNPYLNFLASTINILKELREEIETKCVHSETRIK